MSLSPLPQIIFEPLVRAALLEDLGRAGDITTDAIAPADLSISSALVSRQVGVVAGLDLARLAFTLMNPEIAFEIETPDGAPVGAGETVARVSGPARGILGAERVALNFVSRLSGVASATAAIARSAGAMASVVMSPARPRSSRRAARTSGSMMICGRGARGMFRPSGL